jgi:serine/threonine-protein kinase
VPVADRACPACATPLPEAAQFCMNCGTATPTDPGVPPRVAATGAFEVDKVTRALAGRYRIERVVGEGGMATVYLAADLKHKRQVAVKVMRPELAATLGSERFLREVQIAAQLNHPNILAMHDSGEADGILYYVMPYVEGETLRERLVRDGALPPEEALRLAREIAEALAYAHKRGIIHRDIKPANILLNEGHALIADFGIARAVEDTGGEALTKTGLAVGTPQYMAPEQAAGDKDVDGRADIYATGAILYEMLTGQPPFTGPNARSILTRSLTERPKPVTESRPGLPPAMDALVLKALARNSAERYATGTELVAALDATRGASSPSNPALSTSGATQVLPSAAPSGARAGWRSPRALALAGAAAVTLLLGGGVLLQRGRAGGAVGPTRVAVLPFENQGAAADEFLAAGIADEVRGKLAALSGLQVIASTSAEQYKGTTKSPQEIARELDATYLLVGRVRWTGEGDARQVRVMPELIDGKTGAVKWQQSFEAPVANVFDLQSRLASQVTGALGVTLVGDERNQLAARPTTNVAAYEAYQRALRRTLSDAASLRASVADLEQAVALDSNFTDAWGQLVRHLGLLSGSAPSPDILPRIERAVAQVTRTAPGSAAEHVARSRYYTTTRDTAAAQRELEAALRLAPNDVGVLLRAGAVRSNALDYDAAVQYQERARALDPRSPLVLNQLMTSYTGAGRFAEAIAVGEELAGILPGEVGVARQLVDAYVNRGDLAGARGAIRAAVQRGVSLPELAANLAGNEERAWVLEDADQRLVLRLTPSAFGDERDWWAQSLATLAWQRGDTALARAYADSAIAPTREVIARTGQVSQQDALLGVMLAYLGRATDARTALARARDANVSAAQQSYILLLTARAELALGNRGAALDALERLAATRPPELPGMLRVEPSFSSLKGDPRYERMAQGK